MVRSLLYLLAMSKTEHKFGTKRRADFTAQDNAHLALSTMLGAELRAKTAAASDKAKMTAVVVVSLVASLGVAIILTFLA